jgi:CHAT domain-containing protein
MPEDLARRLPPGVALVDFVRFDLLEQDPRLPGRKGERRTPSYVAFVLQRNRPVQRAALGPAEPIEEAVAHWRQAIRSREPDAAAAAALRKLVWEPIEPLLPPQEKAHPQPPSQPATPDGAAELGTATIYLCPDGRLSSIPWAALPGRVPGGVLLEEYQLAVLPHGQYLLQMFDEAARESASGACLVVGDVRYNEPAAPRPQKVLPGDVNVQRGAAGTVHLWAPQPLRPYDDLEGAAAEVESLIALCEKTRIDVRSLRRADATTDNVLSELPAARVAHFATHGFLADPRTAAGGTTRGPSELRDFLVPAQRTTILSRNPLALSGIVLAGANLPRPVDASGIPQGDGGILSAEAIAALHCPQLELVVLSACETGLGDVAGGEGVYGLQRAFHTAGARNVVASLWSVGDLPTLALMKLMYRQLWVGRQPPIAALRQAQLYIYRHPHHIQRIAELSPDQLVKEPLAVLEGGGAVPPAVPDKPGQNPPRHAPPPQPAHTFHWAGFVLSGAGR